MTVAAYRAYALRRYLNHKQYSVFTGDITDADVHSLRGELSQLMIPCDRVTEITAANRRNVDMVHLITAPLSAYKQNPNPQPADAPPQ